MKIIFLTILLSIASPESKQDQLIVTEKGETIGTFERAHYSIPHLDPDFINISNLNKILHTLDEKVIQDPINATIDDQGEIIDGKPGISLDRDKSILLFHRFFYEKGPMQQEVPKKKNYPKVNSELLAEIKVNNIGSYVTYFKETNKERSHNIRLSTEAINNHVVFPNDEFSFNNVVGERTKEKGYMKAPVIVKGELSEDIGGGICQVSSTLFNAVDLKGIQTVERYSHSRSVPYVPKGQDATVSWWGPDFVFKNNYNRPILIRATARDGKMEINIYSAEDVRYKRVG